MTAPATEPSDTHKQVESSFKTPGDAALQKAPTVSVLIVAFNSARFIADCIGSIARAASKCDVEVLLIDNGDGQTERLVSELFPHVIIAPSQGNIGFAAGNNELAKRASSDLYLLLNPDMVLVDGAIDALLEASREHKDAVAWGGVSLDLSGKPDTGNTLTVPSLPNLLRTALGRSVNADVPSETLEKDKEVNVLMGGLVMIRRAAWEEVNGFDERFFLYCEEVDLFYRLARHGYTFWRVADARGIHDAGHGEAYSPTRNLYRLAGTIEFARHHWSPMETACAVFLIWAGATGRYVAGAILGRWWPRLKLLGKANAAIATRPGLWARGYDAQRGLLAQLNTEKNS